MKFLGIWRSIAIVCQHWTVQDLIWRWDILPMEGFTTQVRGSLQWRQDNSQKSTLRQVHTAIAVIPQFYPPLLEESLKHNPFPPHSHPLALSMYTLNILIIHCCNYPKMSQLMRLWYFYVLPKHFLQMLMCCHPMWLDVWILVGSFVLPYFMCANSEGSGKQRRLWRDCTPEPLQVAYVISTISSWAGSNVIYGVLPCSYMYVCPKTQDHYRKQDLIL